MKIEEAEDIINNAINDNGWHCGITSEEVERLGVFIKELYTKNIDLLEQVKVLTK